jgi:hypothetical protein
MCTAEIEYKQNSGLCNVSKWRKAKKLRLNAKKTDFMLIALKALCNEFFDGEIFALRYSVLCTGSKDANRFPKLQVALFL